MNKIYCFFLTVCLSIFLISCSNELEKVENITEIKIQGPISFEHNEQEFEIINYYQEFQDFLKEAKEQPNNLEALYKQSVHASLRQNGIGYSQLSDWMFTTPQNLEATADTIESLINQQDAINKSIQEELIESSELLPGEDKTIHVFPSLPEYRDTIKDLDYVTGVVWEKDSMLIVIDPLFQQEDLKYTVAHEYHHTVYKETNPNVYYTLLENTLVEGKADVFVEIVYPNTDTAWTEPFSEDESEKVWEIFRENIDSKDRTIIDNFIGGNPYDGIPPWSSYKIGKQIMQDYLLENPHVSIEEWTKLPANEIYQKSKYGRK